jgi:hypothetical protein
VVLVSGSGDCSRAWQTVREVLADCPRGGVHPCVLRVRHVFLSAFFYPVGQPFLTGGCLADRPPGCRGLSVRHDLLADRPRTWYEPSVCPGVGWVILSVFNGQYVVGRGPSAR